MKIITFNNQIKRLKGTDAVVAFTNFLSYNKKYNLRKLDWQVYNTPNFLDFIFLLKDELKKFYLNNYDQLKIDLDEFFNIKGQFRHTFGDYIK